MTARAFEKLLTKLNLGKYPPTLFLRPLHANVEVATYWTLINSGNKTPDYFGPITIYLVREAQSMCYCSLVEDKGPCNLHWYTLPEYRKKGTLSAALRFAILPHIFQDNRECQQITIEDDVLSPENFIASKTLAVAVGFKHMYDSEGVSLFELTRHEYHDANYIDGDLSPLTDTRAEEILSAIQYHSTMLTILNSELEMKLGGTDELQNVKKEIEQMRSDFKNIVLEAFMDKRVEITGENE